MKVTQKLLKKVIKEVIEENRKLQLRQELIDWVESETGVYSVEEELNQLDEIAASINDTIEVSSDLSGFVEYFRLALEGK